MHCGKASTENLLIDLHNIAEYFGMTELTDKCEEAILSQSPSVENALDILIFAEKHNKATYAKVSKLVLERAQEIFAKAEHSGARRSAHVPAAFLQTLFESQDALISEIALFRILQALPTEQQQSLLLLIFSILLPPAICLAKMI